MSELPINQVICGDAVELARGLLPGDSIDLVIADPPYNISRPFRISRKNMRLRTARRNSDICFDFGEWDKFSDEDFVKFVSEVITELNRVLKPNGQAVFFTDKMFISNLWALGESLGWVGKNIIVWHKTNPVPQFRGKNFLSATEFLIWFVKNNGDFTFNFGRQRDMHNLIEGPICMGRERQNHPTQKPEYLMEKLIKWFSNEGDIILGPFVGSGTTCIAARRLNRRYIGFDNNPEYIEIAKHRLAAIPKPLEAYGL